MSTISNGLFSQENILNNQISIHLSNLTIESALDSIALKENIHFTYQSEIFYDKKKMSIIAENEKLLVILRRLIPDTTLDFQALNRHVIIVPAIYKKTSKNENIIPYLSYRKVNGNISDYHGNNGLSYASVGIKGKHVGTISNQDGDFSITLSSNNIKDTLVVSFIGYKNYKIPVSEISNKPLTIKLKEDMVSLQEVIIRSNDPLLLLKAAIRKFPINYPQKPTNITSFYRESVLKNNKYMIYLESVLDIYKNAYKGNTNLDRVKIFKSRKIYDISRLDTISFRLKGGIQGCLMLDIVKYRPEFMKEEFMHLYQYHLDDITTYNNKSVYIIGFQPKPEVVIPLMKGRIFLETNSLAIVQAEFGYEQNKLNAIKNRFIAKGNAKTKVKPLLVNYVVNYRKIDGKYYLNHTLGNLKFKVKNKKRLFSKSFSTSFEMATTDIDTLNVRKFKFRETITPSTILSTEDLIYDATFWGDQNFIKPEDNIQQAIKRISNSMQQVALGKMEDE
ncbi:carboxypeptidase-like regulatory domain-containing protein [Ancylomarina longa]|uniref:carboxypeptidase-like regulatory domain-containing protein n=1 Tax=Ancylomarina longa TaxID=2487017 RepID=UPI001ADEBC07|nr:carboxypeptidase-like regulatory domain-containing protein [Ancylomarina longa]